MKVVYSGPHADVRVPSLGVRGVKRDVPVEVSETVGRALLRLPGWSKHEDAPPPRKPAASVKSKQEGK